MGESPVRSAGLVQGWTLVASAWLAVFASAALLGPVLPSMTAHFRGTPALDVMISFVATLPSLFVALLAIPFGLLADRIGHWRVMFWATLVYGVVGVLPYWLESLPAIVVARGAVGIAEAAIMTCGAALIGHYYSAARAPRWWALQTGTAPIAAAVAIAVGGALGDRSWHTPFLVYGFGLVLFVLVATQLWEPPLVEARIAGADRSAARVNWPRLLGICLITVFAMCAFMITVIQTSFLLTERGIPSPAAIGRWQSLSSLANPLGALLFGVLRWRAPAKLALSMMLMAVGFALMGWLTGWQATLAGAAITNLGCGMVLPTLITWALEGLPAAARGSGAGAWMAASFLGQFLSPLSIVALRGLSGTLASAILSYAAACAVVGIVTLLLRFKKEPVP